MPPMRLKATDVMTAEPVCVGPATTIRELARIFEDHEISGAPVVGQAGTVIGVVSKTDLIRSCSEGTADIPPAYLFEVLSEQGGGDEESAEIIPEPLVCVQDFMTENPVTVSPSTSVEHVATLMFEKRIHRVIVVNHDKFPVGIITSLDLLGGFLCKAEGERRGCCNKAERARESGAAEEHPGDAGCCRRPGPD